MTRVASPRVAAPSGRGAPRRVLALVFPALPIERLRATRPHLFVGPEPVAVVVAATIGRATRLVACDAAATCAGLAVGMTLKEAQARLPGVAVHADDPHADHAWLERLADWCGRYADRVTLCPPDALMLHLPAATGPFDGERALAADLDTRFARRGLIVRHAFGDNATIAEALARHDGGAAPDERGAVRRLPIAALGLAAETTAALTASGIRTVGDAMTPSRAALAARFGTAVVHALRTLAGEDAGPPPPPRTPPPPCVERHLAVPLGGSAALLATVAALADEAGAMLAARGEGGRRWRLRLWRADGDVTTLVVEADRATADPAAPMRRWRAPLAALGAAASGTGGFDLIRLEISLAEPRDASQLTLEGGAGERIASPAGRGAPRRTRARSAAQGALPLPALPDDAIAAIETRGARDRPVHLFDPPEPIEPLDPVDPAGVPARFRWRGVRYDVARSDGPDGNDGRIRYRIEDRRGRRLWLWRDSDTGVDGAGSRWSVAGVFA